MTYPCPEPVASLWFPLVKKFYQQHYPSGKPNKAEPIWVVRQQGKILCAVRLKPFPESQLLTAMVTAPEQRQQGLGSHLLQGIQQELTHTPTYCFAFTHLVAFYERNHFIEIPPEALPDALQERFLAYRRQGRKITPMQYKSS